MTYEQFISTILSALGPIIMPGVQADDLPTPPSIVVNPAPATNTATSTAATTTLPAPPTGSSATTLPALPTGSSATTPTTLPTGNSATIPTIPPTGSSATTPTTPPTGSSATIPTAPTTGTSTTTTEHPTIKTPYRRTALELSQQYFDTRAQCDDGSPAYMCTGIMLRSNKSYSDKYHVWDPSPFSATTGGTSFSWLRSDTRYSHLAFGYNSGFILYPQQKAAAGSTKIEPLCYFLLDASTASRDDHGCGAATHEFPNDSESCDNYDITNGQQWLEHYLSEDKDRQRHQCGFDLTEDKAIAAERFKVATAARALLGEIGFNELNEFRLATWQGNQGSQLPLQAFFYLANTDGLSDAQHYQLDYYNQTHAFMPVIRITMPQTQDQDVQFNYLPNDQMLTPVY